MCTVKNMKIRTAKTEDLEAIATLEEACFPKEEMATKETLEKRLNIFKKQFWLLECDGNIVVMINGMVSNECLIRDEMFEDATLHEEDGDWQMIFGVDTHPDYRRQGLAAALMERVIADTRAAGRRGLVLTCKDKLVHYYAKFGFVNEGVSGSVHGGAVWYDMRLEFL